MAAARYAGAAGHRLSARHEHAPPAGAGVPAAPAVDLRLTPANLVDAYPTLILVDVDPQGLQPFGRQRVDRLLDELATLVGHYRRGGVVVFAGATVPDQALLSRIGLPPRTPYAPWQAADRRIAGPALALLPPPPCGLAIAGLFLYHCVASVAAALWAAGYDTVTIPRACAAVPGVPAPLQARLQAWPRTVTLTA